MCRECVREEDCERGTTTNEGGAYLLNYKGCASCSSKALTEKNVQETRDDEGDVLTRRFEHACKDCDHVVATHEFSMEVDEEIEAHITEMRCQLCGTGDAERNYGI